MRVEWKIKAGALQFVVFIGVVIAILLMAFSTLVHVNSFFRAQTDLVMETVKNADLGVQYTLQNANVTADSTSVQLDSDFAGIKVIEEFWGVFLKTTSVSKIKKNTFIKQALVGGYYEPEERPALFLQDNNRPLVVVGITHIEGKAYLPKQGIRTGNISGTPYYGKSLVYGPSLSSKDHLPEMNTAIDMHLKELLHGTFNSGNGVVKSFEGERQLTNSFQEPTIYLLGNGSITLNEASFIGNICLISDRKITVPSQCKLKDVVLIAPEIVIQDGVKGNFQAIAKEKLTVGKNCVLSYPSTLIIRQDEKKPSTDSGALPEPYQLLVDENSVINGLVVFLGNDDTPNYRTQVLIEKNAEVRGQLYCTMNTELKGTVYGSVFTKGFVANQFGSIYQNHLYNARIEEEKLPAFFAGMLLENQKSKKVAKWLY